jgi:hypothetical protein
VRWRSSRAKFPQKAEPRPPCEKFGFESSLTPAARDA